MADPQPNQPQSIEEIIRGLAAQDPSIADAFGGQEALNQTINKIGATDTKFQQSGGVYFALGQSPQETADRFTQIHVDEYRNSARPSLPALVAHHLDEIGLSHDSPHYKAAILVATRAEVDLAKDPQYHNKNHYADVTAQVAEFVKKNNELAQSGAAGAYRLTPEEMADSITAAVGHDLDHPGGKNATPEQIRNGDAFDKLRLEEQSFRAMEPLLKEAGLPAQSINDIHTMIQTTSPDGPHDILKAIAKAQQQGTPLTWEQIDPNNKMPEMKGLAEKLQQNPKLTARAAILEDADLGASAYEGLTSNIKMSANLTDEVQERGYVNKAGQPENLNGPFARKMFGQFVVKDGPASAAAQNALGQNYTDLQATTAQELQYQDIRTAIAKAAEADPKIIEDFGGKEKFDATMKKIAGVDTQFAQKGGVFFGFGSSPQETAQAFTDIHVDQYRDNARPSLPALVAHHLDEIGLSKDSPHYKAALLAATRAEVDLAKEPQYHNKNHYADVTAQVAEFVKRNNELAEKGVPGAQKLSPEEMADSITAAVSHDIDHPGGKNTAPGEAVTAENRLKLEERSFQAVEPLLKEAGLPQNSIDDIHTMIQTTSPDGPHGILKKVAKAQLSGQPIDWTKIDPDGKMPELKDLAEKLIQDPKLTARAAMLEDADLGASAYEGMKSNVKMSDVFSQELQERNYNENLRGPSARQGFSDFLVGEGPASLAAQDALGQNYKEMYAQTRPVANQMKTLALGIWQDDRMEGGTPFSRVETTGLNEMQVKNSLAAMKEAGLNPVVEQGSPAGKTVFRVEGDDVAKLQAMRENVIAKMDWKPDSTAEGVKVASVKTAPLGNDEIKALNNALASEQLAPVAHQPNTIAVAGYDAQVVQKIQQTTQAVNPPVPPKPPAGNGGGASGANASGSSGQNPPTNAAEATAVTAAVAEKVVKTAVNPGEQGPTASKFMGDPKASGNIEPGGVAPHNNIGGAGAGVVGLVLSGQGLHDAVKSGDKVEMTLAGTNLATATAQTTESVLAATGESLPVLSKATKFVPGLNIAATIADGAYQISKEDTTEHKVERGTVVAATAATGIALGTATATAAEAGVITTGVASVIGTGAVATGTAAVVVAAAPVVATAAAVTAVAYTGQKAIEAKRAWDDVDKTIAENGAATKRQNYKSDDGKPSVLGFKHIAVMMLHHSDEMKDANMNGTAGLQRDQKGRFKIDDFKQIDMRDPKNIAELERVLNAGIAKEDKIIKDNDSFVPKGWRIFSTKAVEKQTDAQMEQADLKGALQELQMYKQELKDWDASHPNDPATTGVAAQTSPPPGPQRPRTKGPGLG